MPKGKREASVVIEHEGIAFEVGRIFRGLVGQRLTNATVASYSSEVDKVTMQVQVAADDPMTTEQLCKELRELLRVAS